MMPRVRKKHVLAGLILALAAGLIALELFVVSPGVRAGCAGPLARVRAWDTLVGLLDDEDPDVQTAASDALVRGGPAAVPALVRGLDRLAARGRTAAAFDLGRIGPDARPALPALRRHMLTDEADDVRGAAARAVGRVVRDDPAAVNELLALLDVGDDAGRVAAARAVGGLSDADRRRAVGPLAALLKDPTAAVREEAAEALGNLGDDAIPAAPALLDALADPDPRVRREVVEALESVRHAPSVDPALAARIGAAVARQRGGRGRESRPGGGLLAVADVAPLTPRPSRSR